MLEVEIKQLCSSDMNKLRPEELFASIECVKSTSFHVNMKWIIK